MRATSSLVRCVPVVLAAAAALPGAAAAQEKVAPESAALVSGTLSFVGHATVGDFVGSTSAVSGAFSGDLTNLHGWVQAPVATLVTGNKLRDRDLRASMEVDRHPTMRLDVSGVTTIPSLAAQGDSFAVRLHGHLAIHGVTRLVDLPVTVVRMADTIHVTSAFPLDLADYRIGGLTKLLGLLRMRRRIDVRVDLRFVRARDAP